VTADQFRELALALDDVEEHAHMGHPDFRVNGRIFASLLADGQRGTVGLGPAEQAALIAEVPAAFAPAAGAWGRQGWTTVALASADRSHVRGALLLAWEAAVAAPRRESRSAGRRPRSEGQRAESTASTSRPARRR
jgi:hypothetical protein